MIPTIEDILRGFRDGKYDLGQCLAWIEEHSRLDRETHPEAVAPKGWKLVPWNPTKRMLEVGDSLCASVGGGPLQRIHYPPGVGPEDVWECMVAAAPDVTFQGSTTPQIQPEGKANG